MLASSHARKINRFIFERLTYNHDVQYFSHESPSYSREDSQIFYQAHPQIQMTLVAPLPLSHHRDGWYVFEYYVGLSSQAVD